MGYTTSFMDNETYGANDINEIVSLLTTEGIEDLLENNLLQYNLSIINRVVRSISSNGVIRSDHTS